MSDQSDALNKMAREKGILPDEPPEELPWVRLPRQGVTVLQFAKQVGAIVGANGLFRREGVPVTINPETGRIEAMEPYRFTSYAETHLRAFTEPRAGTKLPETMAVREARCCLAADAFVYPLRKLRRVHQVQLPVIRRDGHIELLPKGYDPKSGIFTMKDCFTYSLDWDLQRAKLFLDDLLGEFPFANPRSKAAHVTAMMTMYAGALLPAGSKKLNFLYRANVPRAGKGLLVASAVAGPWGPLQVQSIPGANDEFRKVLDTEALNGSPYCFFDEAQSKIVNRALTAYMTAQTWSGRLMGAQQKFVVPNDSVVFLAGNNVDLSSDLAGRCLLVDLFVDVADAQQRSINRVICEAWLTTQYVRADLLAAMWALVCAWNMAKRPKPSNVYRGFEDFAAVIGGIIEHAGLESPLASTAGESDSDYSDMLAIVEHLVVGVQWRAEYDFADLIDVCRDINAFEWTLHGRVVRDDAQGTERFDLTPASKSFMGKIFSQRFGGTIFQLADGRRVRFGLRGRNRQRRYAVEFI